MTILMSPLGGVCASLLLIFLTSSVTTTQAWLYTLPQGSCSNFDSCQTCVVEYASDNGLRRPCTWCATTGTGGNCQMMNQWTGTCGDNRATYRDTCPIPSSNLLPRCVYLRYSFWICSNARPSTRNSQCDADFVEGFCSPQQIDREVELCNGEFVWLERVQTGFGTQNAVEADKNGYGLELNLKYFWFDAGHGEDRRRIITEANDDDDDDDEWLCNAQINPDQAIVMKYQVLLQSDSSTLSGDDLSSGDASNGVSSPVGTIVLSFFSTITASILMYSVLVWW